MRTPVYLRAANRATLEKALPWLFAEDATGFDLYEPGPMVKVEGVYNEETGEVITPPVMSTHYHLNLRAEPEIIEQIPEKFRVEPATPRFVWA